MTRQLTTSTSPRELVVSLLAYQRRFLVGVVASFTSGHCGRTRNNFHLNRAPFAVAGFICATIRETVDGSQIGDDAFIGPRQVFKFFDFVKHAPARVGHLL